MANIRACRPGKREMEEENRRLRAALEQIAQMEIEHHVCKDHQMRAIAVAALAERRGAGDEQEG